MTDWQDWLLTAQRVAIHRAERTAIVADLHLGYGQARQRAGEAVPLPTLAGLLQPLFAVLHEHKLRSLVIAGDLWETRPTPALLHELDTCLRAANLEHIHILPGNHDGKSPAENSCHVADWQVHHGNIPAQATKSVQGHLHPAVSLQPRGPLLPCYLAKPNRLILPAYSPDARGVPVARLKLAGNFQCFAIIEGAVREVTRPGYAARRSDG